MKRIFTFFTAIALSGLVLGALAQKPDADHVTKMMAQSKMAMQGAKKGVTGTSIGTIKRAPAGTTFVLTTAKGDQNVDCSKSKVRNASGQFVKADKLTAGAPAEVTGTWKGRTLFASNIKLTGLKAEKPAGGKMGGMMGGHKLPK